MLLKHVLQELKKYLIDFDTNIISIKKVGSEIIFKIKEKEINIKTEVKGNEEEIVENMKKKKGKIEDLDR